MGTKQVVDLDMTDTDQVNKSIVVDESAPLALTGATADVVEDIAESDRLPDNAVQNADGSVTLTLFYPQTLTVKKGDKVREENYEHLTFHRLNGADQRAIAAASDSMLNVVAFSRSTRISQAIMNVLFDKMDAADISAGAQVFSHFLGSGRKTGK
ncbi:hypothetical protein OIV19_06030 [Brucella sp. HL-2]|nr:hypothetical protein [Brucella sp. HL-2]MCV9907177.1 hypothetical protein [Brucella sp. HL-2]